MAQFKNKKFENKEIDLMSNILYIYLKELKDDLIKSISNTIMSNFILYKQKMINRKLKSVFNIYKAKELLNLNKKFSQWNQNLSLNDKKENNNNYINLNLNVGPIINNNNNNNNNNEKNGEKKIKNNHLRNNYNTINSMRNSNSLPNMSKISLNKKNSNKKRPLSSEESKKNYLSNKISENKNKNNLLLGKNFEEKFLMQKIKRNKNSADKIETFIKRQEIYSKNNFHKKEKIIKDNEDENKLIYTFEPKINESLRKLYKNDNLSVGKRLYNDSIIRRNKKLEKDYNLANMTKNNNKKSFNQKKIIELYEDYNIRKEKNEKLIKKIEKECGYTYVPNVLHKKNGCYIINNKIQYNKSKNNLNSNSTNNINNIENKKIKKNNNNNKSISDNSKNK